MEQEKLNGFLWLVEQIFEALSRQPQSGANLVSREEIEAKTMEGDHSRSEKIKGHLCNAGVCIIWICAVMIIIGVGVYTWNLLMPVEYIFLPKEKSEKILGILQMIAIAGTSVFLGRQSRINF